MPHSAPPESERGRSRARRVPLLDLSSEQIKPPASTRHPISKMWSCSPAPTYHRSSLCLCAESASPLLPFPRFPLSRRYLRSPPLSEKSSVQQFSLPPQFAQDTDEGRKKRVFEDLVSITLEQRLRERARGVEGGTIRAGRELRLLAAAVECSNKRANALHERDSLPLAEPTQTQTFYTATGMGSHAVPAGEVKMASRILLGEGSPLRAAPPPSVALSRLIGHRRVATSGAAPRSAMESERVKGGVKRVTRSMSEIELNRVKELARVEGEERKRRIANLDALVAGQRGARVVEMPRGEADEFRLSEDSAEDDDDEEAVIRTIIKIAIDPARASPPVQIPPSPLSSFPQRPPLRQGTSLPSKPSLSPPKPALSRAPSDPLPVLLPPPPPAFLRRSSASTVSLHQLGQQPLADITNARDPPLPNKSWMSQKFGFSFGGERAPTPVT